jgi:ABC-type uncharacterized transport system permease subunit
MILAASPWWNTALALAAALGYAALALGRLRWQAPAQRALMSATWLLHAAALMAGFSADPPKFGFAPALSVTAWLVLAVYAVETWVYPRLQSTLALAGLGTVAVLLAWVFPGSDQHNLPTQWLSVHWALGVASYAMFALAVFHAWLMRRAEQAMRAGRDASPGLPLLALEGLTFRFVGAGFVLLSATLLAGGWFAHELTGGWVWNHKTVFSLLAWLTTAVLLWGRWRLGWRGRTAVRVLYAGAGLLLLGYVGSRFVLEVLLQRT